MDTLADALIGLDPETDDIPQLSSEDKPSEPTPSLDSILDDKTDENKTEDPLNTMVLIDPIEAASDLDKTHESMEISVDSEDQSKETDLADPIEERIEEAKSSLSEFLKVGDDPPTVLHEFEDGLESEREKIIEDLMSTTESAAKDELLTYTAHFDVLSTEKEDSKVDANTEGVNLDIDSSLKNDPEEVKDETAAATVEDKIEELLVEHKSDDNEEDVSILHASGDNEEGVSILHASGDNEEDVSILNKPKSPEKPAEVTLELSKTVESEEALTKDDLEDKDASKDDIDTLLSTLMPDLESNTKPADIIPNNKKQSIQYLRDVLDKPEERGSKRKISTDSDCDEKAAKKPKVLPNLPEVTLIKVLPKKKLLNFEDLMSNLTKIKLPSASWKVRICAGSNPFSIVEFHEKEQLLRSVKFCKEDFQYKISFNNLPVELLGAPQHVQSLEDVSALLSIVNTLIKNDPVVNYL